MRGVFAAGVLDAFWLAGYDPFDAYYGVSAGACNLASHLAGQYQRNLRMYTNLMSRPDFFSWRKFLTGGHFMDLDWFFDAIDREDPLDIPSLFERLGSRDYRIVCTALTDGQPRYHRPEPSDCNALLKASCSLPILVRHPRPVRGEIQVDGGVADAIPVVRAWHAGARRILVVRSQPEAYRKSPGLETRLVSLAFRRHPAIRRTVEERTRIYTDTVAWIQSPPAGVEVSSIAPPDKLLTSRTSTRLEDLIADYRLGRALGDRHVDQAAW